MSMYETFIGLNPIVQSLIAALFTWGVTAVGAAGVFLFKEINHKVLDTMMGFTAGVMIAASFWSLLSPSIEMAGELNMPKWLPAATGFLVGGYFIRLIDKFLPHLHLGLEKNQAEGPKTKLNKISLLLLAITLHNIPEGLAIGVAFGAVAAGYPSATMAGAIALAIGIGIQNFPEGFAVSMPIRGTGASKKKSFFYGQLSAAVEPIAAMIGASLVVVARPLLPFTLAFAAGAMIFVTVEEVIPESQTKGNSDLATLGLMIGFTIMMILDVALG